ncbi:hypothetical protein [Gracilimonas amylolytica]|uniref:hypothetical protein n=1 Tax=Gracilimonas amylolytica TaxID=1749045 RepID=UPI000CD82162|nr:hypothetical protein [Gracilimonas amylolytica]
MEKVLKIITKQEFTSLYRYGFLPKEPNRIIVEDESSDSFDDLFVERVLQLPYFSGDEEYLVIKVNKTEVEKGTIEIEDVIEVIPFTEAARVSYEQKFDSRLVFKPARFEDLITEVELRIDIEDKIRGAKALWTILNTDELTEHYVQKEDVESAFRARRNGKKSNEFQESFDVHLLTYERYEFFPNTFLGYFYDVGEVFAHSMGLPSFKGSGFYKFLENNKESLKEEKLAAIISKIEESNEIQAFKKKCSRDGLSLYLAGVLFFKFKDVLLESESIYETEIGTIVEWIKENRPYVDELNYAIYLTGVFFGYSKFYSDLYEHEGLRIFGGKFPSKKKSEGKSGSLKDVEAIDKQYEAENEVESKDKTEPKDEELENPEEEKVKNKAQMGIQEIRAQLTQILDQKPDKTIKIQGEFLDHLKTILLILSDKDDLNRDECIEILKKEFSDVIDFKSKIIIQLKPEPELKFED